MGSNVAERARSLVGCRYRPQGRRPELGLDCIGLVCAAFDIPADAIPQDYRLRGGSIGRLTRQLDRFFKPIGAEDVRAGDVLLLRVADEQLHLAIQAERGFIHADAALRVIVETPGRPPWALVSAHRHKG